VKNECRSAQLYLLQLPIWDLGCDRLQGKGVASRIDLNSTSGGQVGVGRAGWHRFSLEETD
jgi:hypothetical protein